MEKTQSGVIHVESGTLKNIQEAEYMVSSQEKLRVYAKG